LGLAEWEGLMESQCLTALAIEEKRKENELVASP
jgi:hypothetical protein